MAQLITEDDLDVLELRVADGRGHVARADLLERWATDAAAFELDDGIRRAHLLLVAAEHFEMAGELDRALSAARRAADAVRGRPAVDGGALVAGLAGQLLGGAEALAAASAGLDSDGAAGLLGAV
uniref:hypothetical protein n=1 Tax=Agromyces zhanjiangensis TaxID=3158562 RepID=UPI00339153DA